MVLCGTAQLGDSALSIEYCSGGRSTRHLYLTADYKWWTNKPPNVKAEPRAASEIGQAEKTQSRALALAAGSTERLKRPPQPACLPPDRSTGGLRVRYCKQKRRMKGFASSLSYEATVMPDKKSNDLWSATRGGRGRNFGCRRIIRRRTAPRVVL